MMYVVYMGDGVAWGDHLICNQNTDRFESDILHCRTRAQADSSILVTTRASSEARWNDTAQNKLAKMAFIIHLCSVGVSG